MTVYELNRNQIVELKQSYLTENNNSVSYEELANADTLVSDNTIFNKYNNVDFSKDDFSC